MAQAAGSAVLKIHCDGEGTPLYLIGGGPAFTTWSLEPVQKALSGGYRVCRWDMRGVGDNRDLAISTDSPLIDQWIEDMSDVLPPEPVMLWGHSWGALQSLLFAHRHPDRVHALILSNPVDPGLNSIRDIELKRYRHPEIDALLSLDDIGTEAERRHAFRSKIASYFLDGGLGWQYSESFSEQDTNNRLNIRIWDEYRRDPMTRQQAVSTSSKITGIIQCSQDVLMPESGIAYAHIVSTDKQYFLDHCGHFPWVERPELYFGTLRTLIDRAAP